MEISELVGAWPVVLHLHSMGELRREDIVWALRSGEPMPPQAAPLLADIVEKKYKFKRARKGMSKFAEVAIISRFLELQEEVNGMPKERGGETAYTYALRTVATECRISPRRVEYILNANRTFYRKKT